MSGADCEPQKHSSPTWGPASWKPEQTETRSVLIQHHMLLMMWREQKKSSNFFFFSMLQLHRNDRKSILYIFDCTMLKDVLKHSVLLGTNTSPTSRGAVSNFWRLGLKLGLVYPLGAPHDSSADGIVHVPARTCCQVCCSLCDCRTATLHPFR